jgi:hypothetical protein
MARPSVLSTCEVEMEHRHDLERILLDGLPDLEREHVIEAMDSTTAAKLRRLRAGGSDGAGELVEDD